MLRAVTLAALLCAAGACSTRGGRGAAPGDDAGISIPEHAATALQPKSDPLVAGDDGVAPFAECPVPGGKDANADTDKLIDAYLDQAGKSFDGGHFAEAYAC